MRILLADDHPVVRRLVRNLLQTEDDFVVCAEAATGREAVTLTASEHPDIVVLDLSMPDLNGFQAARLIHENHPEVAMIVLSMHEPFELMDQLTASGVQRCLLKTDLQDLIGTLRDVGPSQQPSSKSRKPSESLLTPEKVHAR